MIEIKELDIEAYRGQEFTVEYDTKGYYEVTKNDFSFSFAYTPFETPQKRGFKDTLCDVWLDNPKLYGAFFDNTLVGFIEINPEEWNNRLRISNICIEPEHRHRGIGTMLMDRVKEYGREHKFRQLILETQSCNEFGIKFYLKQGFEMTGFDLYSYSDKDIENHEIRFEFIYKLGE